MGWKGQIHWTCSFGGYRNKNLDLESMLRTWLCNGLPGLLSSSQSFQKLIEKDVKNCSVLMTEHLIFKLPKCLPNNFWLSDYPPLETRYRWNTFQIFLQVINCNISNEVQNAEMQLSSIFGQRSTTACPGSEHDVYKYCNTMLAP